MYWRSARLRCGARFDVPRLTEQLQEVQRELEDPCLWDSPDRATALLREQSELARICTPLRQFHEDHAALAELIGSSAYLSESEFSALEQETLELRQRWEQIEYNLLYAGESPTAVRVTVTAGSGGTEAQDFTGMLARMYAKWGQKQGYRVQWLEEVQGDIAGLRQACLRIEGAHVLQGLQQEAGVHRLCRKSPFGSGVRHTSFASVSVEPDVKETPIHIVLRDADLLVQTFRAGGKGGQHVNKTESAVRIQHRPSGLVVRCQAERCQHANRAAALKELVRQLTLAEQTRRNRAHQVRCLALPQIDFGQQIRTYALDQSRITDHRTGRETHQAQAVLDGNLQALLKGSRPDVSASDGHIEFIKTPDMRKSM